MKSDSAFATVLLVILACSGVLNIVLAARVVSLHYQFHPNAKLATEGTVVPDLVGRDPNGTRSTIRFRDSEKPTVLLVTNPGCQWCERNMPNWQELVREAGQRYRFVVVSLADSASNLPQYLSDKQLKVAGLSALPREQAFDLIRAGGTPQTIVVGRDATVLKYWQGAYSGSTKADVERYFNVTLPVEAAPAP